MKTMFRNLSRTALAVIAFSLTMTSCKKDNDVAPLKVQNSTAAVPSISSVTIYGNYGNPALGPNSFGTRYVNIITGAQDATGAIAENLLFKGINNGTVSPASGYTFSYLVESKALSAVTPDDYDNSDPVSTFGRNTNGKDSPTPNGWWDYDPITHKATPVQNMILFLKDGNSIYAFKATSIDGEGSPLNNRGIYHFDIGLVTED